MRFSVFSSINTNCNGELGMNSHVTSAVQHVLKGGRFSNAVALMLGVIFSGILVNFFLVPVNYWLFWVSAGTAQGNADSIQWIRSNPGYMSYRSNIDQLTKVALDSGRNIEKITQDQNAELQRLKKNLQIKIVR